MARIEMLGRYSSWVALSACLAGAERCLRFIVWIGPGSCIYDSGWPLSAFSLLLRSKSRDWTLLSGHEMLSWTCCDPTSCVTPEAYPVWESEYCPLDGAHICLVVHQAEQQRTAAYYNFWLLTALCFPSNVAPFYMSSSIASIHQRLNEEAVHG